MSADEITEENCSHAILVSSPFLCLFLSHTYSIHTHTPFLIRIYFRFGKFGFMLFAILYVLVSLAFYKKNLFFMSSKIILTQKIVYLIFSYLNCFLIVFHSILQTVCETSVVIAEH